MRLATIGVVVEILNFLDKGAMSSSSKVVGKETILLPLPLNDLVFWLWGEKAERLKAVSLILIGWERQGNLEEAVVYFFFRFSRETLVGKSSANSIVWFSIDQLFIWKVYKRKKLHRLCKLIKPTYSIEAIHWGCILSLRAHLFTIIVSILPISIWNMQNELTILNMLEYE